MSDKDLWWLQELVQLDFMPKTLFTSAHEALYKQLLEAERRAEAVKQALKLSGAQPMSWSYSVDDNTLTTEDFPREDDREPPTEEQVRALGLDQYITSQMFEDTADYIREHGWTQRTEQNLAGNVCAIGALRRATPLMSAIFDNAYGPRAVEAGSALWPYLMDLMGLWGQGFRNIPEWNDRPERTGEEVLDALMLAAKKLRDLGR